MKTAVVVNTRARALRERPELVSGIHLAAAPGALVLVSREIGDLPPIAERVAEFRADRVVCCGGDGSLMAVCSALHRAGCGMPEIVVAPGGTVATVARNWGQRAGLVETVRRATRGAPPRRALSSPTLLVNDGTVSRVGFIVGTGLVARFFERYYAAGGGGYAAAARIVARIFLGSFVADRFSREVLEPLACTLSVDGRALDPDAYSLIVSAVVRDLGLHMLVTHRAAEDPNRPHLIASPLSTRQLGPQAPRVLAGKSLRGAGCFDDLVSNFEIAFPAAQPGPYVLDGDVLFASRVAVTAGPQIPAAAY